MHPSGGMPSARLAVDRPLPESFHVAAGYFGALAAVVVFGGIAWATTILVPLPRVSILFLCAVLASAILWGQGPALFAALLGVAATAYFFYPPFFDFGVASAQDLLDLAVFAVVAVVSGTLSEELRRQRAAAEDARVKAKTEELRAALLNSVSHDLQTPLASIIGSATALQSFGELYDSRARADLVATIREESERLNDLIGNILDLSRIRAGAISPRFELIELADILDSALRKTQRALAAHDVRVALADNLPMLHVDPFLIEQALVHLLENAAKYAAGGGWIEVSARLANGSVEIAVADSGCGISAQDLPNVFNEFYRGALSDAKPAGTGLGLAICRAFVEANNGDVEALSPGAGAGSTFRIRLPVAAQTPSEMAASDA